MLSMVISSGINFGLSGIRFYYKTLWPSFGKPTSILYIAKSNEISSSCLNVLRSGQKKQAQVGDGDIDNSQHCKLFPSPAPLNFFVSLWPFYQKWHIVLRQNKQLFHFLWKNSLHKIHYKAICSLNKNNSEKAKNTNIITTYT